jgi:outer membrane lipoprotein SlyB
MKTHRRFVCALAIAVAAGPASAQPPDACDACGVVVSIQMTTERTQWTPLGSSTPSVVTATGSPTGAVSQLSIGPKFQSEGVVVLGAAGGAAYAKRPNAYEKPRWDVTVKMDRGGTRVISQKYEPLLREGDRVRVLGTQLELVNL